MEQTMKKLSELKIRIHDILNEPWTTQTARDVPEASELPLSSNRAAEFQGAVLYADLAGSTKLVDRYRPFFAAKVYKVFLFSCCEIIRNNGGTITAFDGDRVMAIYSGNGKCTRAVSSALQIRFMSRHIQEALQSKYDNLEYRIDYAVGIDVGLLYAVRMGVFGDNDISWIGPAANHAAKLSAKRDERFKIFISGEVYTTMNDSVRIGNTPTESMWVDLSPRESPKTLFASSWYMSIS